MEAAESKWEVFRFLEAFFLFSERQSITLPTLASSSFLSDPGHESQTFLPSHPPTAMNVLACYIPQNKDDS